MCCIISFPLMGVLFSYFLKFVPFLLLVLHMCRSFKHVIRDKMHLSNLRQACIEESYPSLVKAVCIAGLYIYIYIFSRSPKYQIIEITEP